MVYIDAFFDMFLGTVQNGPTPTTFNFKIFFHKYED